MSQWRCLWYVWVCMRPCVGCLGRLHDWVCRLFMHVLLCWKVESSLLFKSFLRELLEVVRMHLNVIGNYEWDMKRIISLSYTWRMVSLEANQTNTLFNSNTSLHFFPSLPSFHPFKNAERGWGRGWPTLLRHSHITVFHSSFPVFLWYSRCLQHILILFITWCDCYCRTSVSVIFLNSNYYTRWTQFYTKIVILIHFSGIENFSEFFLCWCNPSFQFMQVLISWKLF